MSEVIRNVNKDQLKEFVTVVSDKISLFQEVKCERSITPSHTTYHIHSISDWLGSLIDLCTLHRHLSKSFT